MDAELTPLGNVAFNGAVAEEINRLNRELKQAWRVGDVLADWMLVNRACACRRDWVCGKCRVLKEWEDVRRGDR